MSAPFLDIKSIGADKTRMYMLRFMREEDLEWARNLHNDPSVLSMLTDPTVVTTEMQKMWFESLQKSKKSKRIVVRCNDERIGLIRLDDIDLDNRSCAVGLDIDKEHRGKGHATPIYVILLEYCFSGLDAHRCWLFVAAYNEIARNLYRKLGFVEEGVARKQIYRFDTYHDYILMGMLQEEYAAMRNLHDMRRGLSYTIEI